MTRINMLQLEDDTGALDQLLPFAVERAVSFASAPSMRGVVELALRIRAVETGLLKCFGEGKLHGTIHTCVGQELCGALVGSLIDKSDFVTSNHRCHGHFIGATGNWHGLIDEIVGNIEGVCGGIGGSQHLYAANFISNGQQGGLLPVAAGVALDFKKHRRGSIVVSFIGEGTLGQGVVYETFNISSLWNLPHLVICENNFYSQSTSQKAALAGSISARAAAFGWDVYETSTWDPMGFMETLRLIIGHLRAGGRPSLLLVRTYRLNAHSKGDDLRPKEEVETFRRYDPVSIITKNFHDYKALLDALIEETDAYIGEALRKPAMSIRDYVAPNHNGIVDHEWRLRPTIGAKKRINQSLNDFYDEYLRNNDRAFFLGEDIADPYGGAFKVSLGLESRFPERIITTPISEAAIVGVGIGLSLVGNRPIVEIMFGDFLPLAMDQLVNNASKFHYMYNKQVTCPIVIRTPMGGRRGYGPTHSQSLEGVFAKLSDFQILSLNSLMGVDVQLAHLGKSSQPTLIFENKADYSLTVCEPPHGYIIEISSEMFPSIRLRPQQTASTLTIVTYGGIARLLADNLLEIFDQTEFIPELIVLTSLRPLNVGAIVESVRRTNRLAVVEEGDSFAGVGSEISARVGECVDFALRSVRIGGLPQPIPSCPLLEEEALPSISKVCEIVQYLRDERLR